jgi:hypothetical protein
MPNFVIDDIFKEIVHQLQNGKRPRLKLKPTEIEECVSYWNDSLHLKSPKEKLISLLCILDHTTNSHPDIQKLYIETIKVTKDKELLVYLLSGSLKHITEHCHKNGNRVSFDYLNTLEGTINSSEPEVVEWTLRCIEALGSQSIFFKQKVLAARPSLFKMFNKNNRSVAQLIDYLEKRWSDNGKR